MPQPSNTASLECSDAVLSPVRAVFRAVASTIVPDAAGLDEKQWAELEQLIEDTLRTRPRRQQNQLRVLLRAIQYLPLFRYGRTFTSLDRHRRELILRYLQDHRLQLIRSGFWGVRTLTFLGYYGRPEAAKAIGYVPTSRGWGAAP